MVTASKNVVTFNELLERLITWILAVSFLVAGTAHWGNPYFFLGSVYAYQLADSGTGQIVAMSLPLIQLGLSVSLLLRLFVDAAHLGTLFFLLVFATAQTIAFCRGLDISCGCFGAGSDKPIGWLSLSIVYGLLFMSLLRNGLYVIQVRRVSVVPT